MGYPAREVHANMERFAQQARNNLRVLDNAMEGAVSLPPEDKLLYAIAVACRFFDAFLRIHPYADGNGHCARVIMWAILGRFGYWLRHWPIDPRPADPYVRLIELYRAGRPDHLEKHILSCIAN